MLLSKKISLIFCCFCFKIFAKQYSMQVSLQPKISSKQTGTHLKFVQGCSNITLNFRIWYSSAMKVSYGGLGFVATHFIRGTLWLQLQGGRGLYHKHDVRYRYHQNTTKRSDLSSNFNLKRKRILKVLRRRILNKSIIHKFHKSQTTTWLPLNWI